MTGVALGACIMDRNGRFGFLVLSCKPLIVNLACLLDVDHPSLLPQRDMQATIAIAHTRLAELLDPSFDGRLVGAPDL